jgi:hypothetical protein
MVNDDICFTYLTHHSHGNLFEKNYICKEVPVFLPLLAFGTFSLRVEFLIGVVRMEGFKKKKKKKTKTKKNEKEKEETNGKSFYQRKLSQSDVSP